MSFLSYIVSSFFVLCVDANLEQPTSSFYSSNLTDSIIHSCPPFESIPYANVKIQNHIGSASAIVTCSENYSLIGRNIIYCDDGIWNFGFDGIPPRCVKRCPPPPILEHGEVNLEKNLEDIFNPIGTYVQGTIAKYICSKGYILEPSSSSTRLCQNGYWTGIDAYCRPNEEMSCASPPVIQNGDMQPSLADGYSLVAVGQEVLYECYSGYRLIGPDRIKCTDQGIWLPKPPSCHKETGNPFADFSTPAPASNGIPDFFSSQPAATTANSQNLWGQNTASSNVFQVQQPQTASHQPFNDLTGFFNTNEPSVFDPIPPVDQKQAPAIPPQPSLPPQRPPQPSKLLTGDLETSLNSLVENLTIDSGSGKWNSPKNQPKTSAAGGWQPQPMAATTAASYRPMMGAQQTQMMGQQPAMQPMMGTSMPYPMGAVQQPQIMGSPKTGGAATQSQQQPPFDPFGAL